MAVLLFACSSAFAQETYRVPMDEQRPVGGEWSCHVEDLPAPKETTVPVPVRPGFVWLPGHYRCITGIWEHVEGRWISVHRGSVLEADALVSWYQKKLVPAPDFEFFLNPSGSASLRRTEVMAEHVTVKGEFNCHCLGHSGSCAAQILPSGALACRSNGCELTCLWQLEVDGELRASVVVPDGEHSC